MTTIGALLLSHPVYPQPGVEMFRLYNGGYAQFEYFFDVFQKVDGGYYVVGSTYRRRWALSIHENGNPIWEVITGEPLQQGAGDKYLSCIETDDGHLLAGGVLDGMFIAEMLHSESGDQIWLNQFIRGRCQSVIELKSGEFMLAGYTASSDLGYITQVDEDGRQNWELCIDPLDLNNPSIKLMSMRETDGGVVVAGSSDNRGIFLKVDFNGELDWIRSFDANGNESLEFESVVSNLQGGFVMTGRLDLARGQGSLFYMNFVNANGWMTSNSILPQWATFNVPYAINRLENSGYVVVGYGSRFNRQNIVKLTIAKTNPIGEIIWNTHLDQLVGEQGVGLDYSLRSVITTDDNRIVACGESVNRDEEGGIDGLLVRFSADCPGPEIFYKFPIDSILSVLREDSLEFIVRARNQEGLDMPFSWFYGDSMISESINDTSIIISFHQLAEIPVTCRITYGRNSTSVTWHVTVTDLYVSSYSPDSLNLTLRRGQSVDFSLDTVRAVEGDPVQYLWRKSNDFGEIEDAGTESRATVAFLQSGHYSIEGLAYRGESSDAVTWSVEVRGVVWNFAPEDLALEVLPDSLIRFEAIPTNPEDSTLSARWFVDDELAGEDILSLDWGFFYPVHSVHNVLCVLSDSVESDTVCWTVTVRDPNLVGDKRDDYPTRVELLSVSPNPFNSTLMISFSVGQVSKPVKLAIHDISGREVARLAETQAVNPQGLTANNDEGVNPEGMTPFRNITWNASDVPAGVYFVRMQSGAEIATKKVVLIR